MIFRTEPEKNLKVGPHCGTQLRATAQERLAWTFDENAYTRIELPKVPIDPLKFRDSKKYPDRLKAARAANPHCDALTNAAGTIEGKPLVLGVQDFAFMGGSMGMAVGAAFVAGASRALSAKSARVF